MQTIRKFMIYMLEHKKKKEKKVMLCCFPNVVETQQIPIIWKVCFNTHTIECNSSLYGII